MPDTKDFIDHLHKQHQASQDKYTYFLLAAAGAAIGFAVQKTEGLILSWWMLPVAVATLCWGVSFYFGCKCLTWVQKAIFANLSLLELQCGVHPKQPQEPEEVQVALSGVKKALNFGIKKAGFYTTWQFRALIVGAIFFIAWRVAEMVRLTLAT